MVRLFPLLGGLWIGCALLFTGCDAKEAKPESKRAAQSMLAEANVPVDPAEEKAAKLFEELGGKVVRDELAPGKPVVELNFVFKPLTDKSLNELAAFNQLRALNLGHTR